MLYDNKEGSIEKRFKYCVESIACETKCAVRFVTHGLKNRFAQSESSMNAW